MTIVRRPAVIALVLALFAPVSAATWGEPRWAQHEPSTYYDNKWSMFLQPPQSLADANKVYFSGNWVPVHTTGFLPTLVLVAYFGVWRDCDKDGYIGSGTLGRETYPATLPGTDTTLCPAGSRHNDGRTVREFLWIGPGSRDIHDPGARVWMDWLRPDAASPVPKTRVDEELRFHPDGASPLWQGSTHRLLPGQATRLSPAWATFYAAIGTPEATLTLPSSSTAYGALECQWAPMNWRCDAWTGSIRPGTRYHLRDVDCYHAVGHTYGFAPDLRHELGRCELFSGWGIPEPDVARVARTAADIAGGVAAEIRETVRPIRPLPDTCHVICTGGDLGIPGPLALNVYWNGTSVEWVYEGSFECSLDAFGPEGWPEFKAACTPLDPQAFHCVTPTVKVAHTGAADTGTSVALDCGHLAPSCAAEGAVAACVDYDVGTAISTLFCRGARYPLSGSAPAGGSWHVGCFSDPPEPPTVRAVE